MNLSVTHHNALAIALYEKLGFERAPSFRAPSFTVTTKNSFNEKLFIGPDIMRPDCWFIEASERPAPANNEPQPTAERFADMLFPNTDAWLRAPSNRIVVE